MARVLRVPIVVAALIFALIGFAIGVGGLGLIRSAMDRDFWSRDLSWSVGYPLATHWR